uniref:Uncharacterized protein n=1 Tax=Arundo donax TaxID=35708 RepID=A0A0A9CBZ1_ARUDO
MEVWVFYFVSIDWCTLLLAFVVIVNFSSVV